MMGGVSESLIPEPARPNPLLRAGVWASEKIVGRRLLPARLLAWYPRAAIGAGVLESLVAHREPSPRLLMLVRVTASLTIACPFCVDMNSFRPEGAGVTPAELDVLRRFAAAHQAGGAASEGDILAGFAPAERTAIRYAAAISATPLSFPDALRREVTDAFAERDVVILATTAAQVNFWGRTIQALGIPPAGFCTVPPAG